MSMSAIEPVRICASDELVEGGTGLRRQAKYVDGVAVVFFVRLKKKKKKDFLSINQPSSLCSMTKQEPGDVELFYFIFNI